MRGTMSRINLYFRSIYIKQFNSAKKSFRLKAHMYISVTVIQKSTCTPIGYQPDKYGIYKKHIHPNKYCLLSPGFRTLLCGNIEKHTGKHGENKYGNRNSRSNHVSLMPSEEADESRFGVEMLQYRER